VVTFLVDSDKKGGFLIPGVMFLNLFVPNLTVFSLLGTESEPGKILIDIYSKKITTPYWIEDKDAKGKIYIDEYPEILEILKKEKVPLITKDKKKVTFSGKKEKLTLDIEIVNGIFVPHLKAGKRENIKMLTPSLLLAGNKIISIEPLKSYIYPFPPDFLTSFKAKNLNVFLSLALSTLGNVEVKVEGYEIKEKRSIEITPSIVIEDVDDQGNLYLFPSFYFEGYSPMNIDSSFEILSKVDHVKKEIELFNVIYRKEELSELIEKVESELYRLKRKHKLEEGFYFSGTGRFVIEKGLAEKFLEESLFKLLKNYPLVGKEFLKKFNLRYVRPKLKVNFSYGIDYLEGKASAFVDDEEIPLMELLESYKRSGYVVLKDGTKGILPEDYIGKLLKIIKRGKRKGEVKVSFFDLPEIEELIEEKTRGEVFKKSREIFTGFNTIPSIELDYTKVKVSLREYQKYGVKWLKYLYDNRLGGCLADDMGLGKTIQALTFISRIAPSRPVLIVVPKTLLFNWQGEIEKVLKSPSYYIYYGSNRRLEEIEKHEIVITTYGTLRSDIEKLREIEFDTVILDESQNIKNPESQISRAVILLKAPHRFTLSGTPIENNLSEIYSLFRFLNPAMFGTFSEFKERYLYPIQKDKDEKALEELRRKIYPFILRRTKREVLRELPPKIEKVLFVELTEEQKKLYEARRIFYRKAIEEKLNIEGFEKSRFFILRALLELRQIASVPEALTDNRITSAKREVLIQQIKDAVENDHKVLVFTNFLEGVRTIVEDIRKEKIRVLSITGETSTKQRKNIVERFQNEKDIKALVMTTKSGGVGLNLTAADIVFIYDPWWNVAAENQAIDRTHRIGQDRTVLAYRLIAKDTIEEKILKLQEEKRKLVENLITSDFSAIKNISEEDIELLFS